MYAHQIDITKSMAAPIPLTSIQFHRGSYIVNYIKQKRTLQEAFTFANHTSTVKTFCKASILKSVL